MGIKSKALILASKAFKKVLINAYEKSLDNFNGGGKFIKTEDMIEITDHVQGLDKIYIPIRVYTNRKQYWLVNEDGYIVSGGNIDKEGPVRTASKDFLTVPDVHNICIAVVLEDEGMLDCYSNTDVMLDVLKQIRLGNKYVRANGHHKK